MWVIAASTWAPPSSRFLIPGISGLDPRLPLRCGVPNGLDTLVQKLSISLGHYNRYGSR